MRPTYLIPLVILINLCCDPQAHVDKHTHVQNENKGHFLNL